MVGGWCGRWIGPCRHHYGHGFLLAAKRPRHAHGNGHDVGSNAIGQRHGARRAPQGGRASVRLALVAAIQVLPPRQRAAFLLCDVLSLPPAGAAEVLYGLGAALGRRGGEDLGLIYLQLALYLVPSHPLALLSLGDLYESLKKPELANKIYKGRAVGNEWVVTQRPIGRTGTLARFDTREEAAAWIAERGES